MVNQRRTRAKGDMEIFKEEIIHEIHVLSENLVGQIKQVAEGVRKVDGKLERFRKELKNELTVHYESLSLAIATLDKKVEKYHEELKTEIQRFRQELKEEIQGFRQELKEEIQGGAESGGVRS